MTHDGGSLCSLHPSAGPPSKGTLYWIYCIHYFMEGVGGGQIELTYFKSDFIHCSKSIAPQEFDGTISRFCYHQYVWITKRSSWSVNWWKMMAKHICCAVFRVVLSAWRWLPPSLSLSCYTVGLSAAPLWGPIPSKALLLSIVLVFGALFEAFPYQMCKLQLSYL